MTFRARAFERGSTLCAARVDDLRVVRERRVFPGGLPLSPPLHALVPSPEPARPAEPELEALVRRVQQGDLSAFDALYHRTREDAARTLSHLVGRRADLEDLLQETYLQLLRSVKRFRGDSQFRTFLYRVCTNVALMHLRWRRRRPEDVVSELPDAVASSNPEGEAARREAARLVELALEGLTAKKRIVFVYHELCGMGPEEIATIVGSSPNTVRSRLHHARLEFAGAMKRLLARRAPGGGRE